MTDTKERILHVALHLFAKEGFEAVSVSMIAGELGITKGALYKHYQNKRAIFESIVKRMFELDEKRAKRYDVPPDVYEKDPKAYSNRSLAHIKEFTVAQLDFWTEDEFASDFRKMLTLEQYRSTEMSELYNNCLVLGPVSYMEDLFRELITEKVLREINPRELALEFFAPLFLLISVRDHNASSNQENSDQENSKQNILDETKAMLAAHVDRFFRQYQVE